VDNVFVHAPKSFEWDKLLAPNALPELPWYSQISAFMVGLWVTLFFLLVIGFAYSYYFSAFTMVYYLMRRKVDDTELDEVYLEEDEPDEPLLPPAPPAPAPSGAGTPLQMVEPPGLRTPPSPATTDGPGAAPPTEPERPAEGTTPAS
jgi:hypothetical protein